MEKMQVNYVCIQRGCFHVNFLGYQQILFEYRRLPIFTRCFGQVSCEKTQWRWLESGTNASFDPASIDNHSVIFSFHFTNFSFALPTAVQVFIAILWIVLKTLYWYTLTIIFNKDIGLKDIISIRVLIVENILYKQLFSKNSLSFVNMVHIDFTQFIHEFMLLVFRNSIKANTEIVNFRFQISVEDNLVKRNLLVRSRTSRVHLKRKF